MCHGKDPWKTFLSSRTETQKWGAPVLPVLLAESSKATISSLSNPHLLENWAENPQGLWASSWNGVGNCAISTHMAFPLEQRQSAVVSWRLSKDTWIKCYLCLWMQLLQRGIHFDPVSHGRQIYSFCLQLHVGDNKRRDQMTLFLPINTFHLIPGKYIWVNLIEALYLFILSENFPQEDKQFKTLQGVGEETKDREERNNYFENPLGKTVLALLAKQEEKQN